MPAIPAFPLSIQDGGAQQEREAIMEYTSEHRAFQERIGMMIWPTDPRALVNALVEVEEAGVRTDISLPTPAPIPVLMAALGPATFRLAGEIADGILPFLCPLPYLLDTALPVLHAGAAAVGRPRPPIVAHVPVALTEGRATALQAGREGLGFYMGSPFYRKMLVAAGFSIQEVEAVADTLLERLMVYGNASQIKDQLLELLGRGVDELAIGPVWVSDAAQETTQLARMIGQL